MATDRPISSGAWNTFLEIVPDEGTGYLFVFMRTCDATEMSGFFPLSVAHAADRTKSTPEIVTKRIQALEELGLIVYDGGYLFIPNYAEDIHSIKTHSEWRGWDTHLLDRIDDYRGALDNRAYLAFRKRFNDWIDRAVERAEKRKIEELKKKNAQQAATVDPPPAAPPKTQTAPALTLTPAKATPAATEPDAAASGEPTEEPTFGVVREFFRNWRSNLGEACPQDAAFHADQFYAWLGNNPRADWRRSAGKWIYNAIRDERDAVKEQQGLAVAGVPTFRLY